MPLAAARLGRDELVVDVRKDQVTSAPRVDEDGHLSEAQEAEISRYNGISRGTGHRPGRPTPVPATAAGTLAAGPPTMR